MTSESRVDSALLGPFLDRGRSELLLFTTAPSRKRARHGGDAGSGPSSSPPEPPAAPSPQLPPKIVTLAQQLNKGMEAMRGEQGLQDDDEEERLVVALAGGLTHYITAMLLPGGPPLPSEPRVLPVVALQSLGVRVATWLGAAWDPPPTKEQVEQQQQAGQQQVEQEQQQQQQQQQQQPQPQQEPPPQQQQQQQVEQQQQQREAVHVWQEDIEEGLIGLLAALLILERAALLLLPAGSASTALTVQVAQAIATAGGR